MPKKKSPKWYVVWHGHEPGVYDTWADCLLQVKGFPEAKYKSFSSKQAAELAYQDGPYLHWGKDAKKDSKSGREAWGDDVILNSICADAACNGSPGTMEYQIVFTDSGEKIYSSPKYRQATNNVGEFLGLVHALGLIKNGKVQADAIYTDSRTAMAWIRKKKCNSKLVATNLNKPVFDLIARAEQWLKTNTVSIPILKWDTKTWGEIPADYGRK